MEADEGNIEEARGIFARGAQGSPHAPLLIAWAELEEGNGRHAPLLGASMIQSDHCSMMQKCVTHPLSSTEQEPPYFPLQLWMIIVWFLESLLALV